MLTVIMFLHIEYCLSLLSLFPVSQSKLSTLQVLCPTMSKEDRETLVALATAGIINWQENDGKNTHVNTHTHANAYIGILNKANNDHFWLYVTDVYVCLAVLLCCLKANTQVDEEIVQAILATVMEWRNSKEDWFLFGR